MRNSGSARTAFGPWVSVGVILLGLAVAVISVYLVTNPAGLPSYLLLPYLVRFLPVAFLAALALGWPRLIFVLALLAMFGGRPVDNLLRPILLISPFWVLLTLATGSQLARNIRLGRAIPWEGAFVLILLAAVASVYQIGQPLLTAPGMVVPLLVGATVIIAAGTSQTWRHVGFVLAGLTVAFLALDLQLLPVFLTPNWVNASSIIAEAFGDLTSSLRQSTSLEWLFNVMAILMLGMAMRSRGRIRFLLLALFLTFGASSVLTYTRGAYLSMGAGMLALLHVEGRRSLRDLFWITVAAFLVIGVAYYSEAFQTTFSQRGLAEELRRFQGGEGGRLGLLVQGLKEMPGHLLVGRGPVGAPSHSLWLDTWNNLGGIYALAFGAFILTLFRRSYRMAKAPPEATSSPWGRAIALGLYCSFASALVNSLFDPTLFALSFSVVFWTMRALEMGIWRSGLIVLPKPARRRPGLTRMPAQAESST